MAYLNRSDADLRLYRRLYLWDENATLRLRTAVSHFGDLRYGMPPYNVQLNYKMEGSRSPVPMGVAHYGSMFFGEHLMENSHQEYWDTMEALASVTLARDKALVLTAQHGPVRAGSNVLPGQHTASDLLRRW